MDTTDTNTLDDTPNTYTPEDLRNCLERCDIRVADVDRVLGAWGTKHNTNAGAPYGWSGGFAFELRDGRYGSIYAAYRGSGRPLLDCLEAQVIYVSCAEEAMFELGGDPDINPPELQRWVRDAAARPEDAAKTIEMSLPVASVLDLMERIDKAQDVARDLRNRLYCAQKAEKEALARENEAKLATVLWQGKFDALADVLRNHGVSNDACFLPVRAADDLLTELEAKLAAALARAESAEARLLTASHDAEKFVAEVEARSQDAGPEQVRAFDAYGEHFRAESAKLRTDEK